MFTDEEIQATIDWELFETADPYLSFSGRSEKKMVAAVKQALGSDTPAGVEWQLGATLELQHSDVTEHLEYWWWLAGPGVWLVVGDQPHNYNPGPWLAHTMTAATAENELKKLLTEGWQVVDKTDFWSNGNPLAGQPWLHGRV